MEYKEITKVDGKRLFLEIPSKFIKEYSVKKEDVFLLIKKIDLYEEDINKLLGNYISFLLIEDDIIEEFSGIIVKNDLKYTPEEKELKFKYVLITEEEIENDLKDTVLLEFDDLKNIGNFKILNKEKRNRIRNKCSNKRCNQYLFLDYKYCPKCGKPNENYVKKIK